MHGTTAGLRLLSGFLSRSLFGFSIHSAIFDTIFRGYLEATSVCASLLKLSLTEWIEVFVDGALKQLVIIPLLISLKCAEP